MDNQIATHKGINWDPYLYHVQEITRPAFKNQTIKLLDLPDLGLGNVCLGVTPKAQATKDKINRLHFITIKNLRVSKGTVRK